MRALLTVLQGQDGPSLSHVMSSQLRSLSSPFVSIEPVPPTALAPVTAANSPQGPVEELHFVAEATAVAAWLAGPGAGLVLGQLRKQGTDGLAACQEDAQREVKCRQAMLSVQTFEANGTINPQVGTWLRARGHSLTLSLRGSDGLGSSHRMPQRQHVCCCSSYALVGPSLRSGHS